MSRVGQMKMCDRNEGALLEENREAASASQGTKVGPESLNVIVPMLIGRLRLITSDEWCREVTFGAPVEVFFIFLGLYYRRLIRGGEVSLAGPVILGDMLRTRIGGMSQGRSGRTTGCPW